MERLRLPRRQGKDVFVEVGCEAAGIAPRLAIVCDPFGVPVERGGFDGLKTQREAAERAAARDVPTVPLHIRDHDRQERWIIGAKAQDDAA